MTVLAADGRFDRWRRAFAQAKKEYVYALRHERSTRLMSLASIVLVALRLVLFALTLGLTLISFEAYRRNGTQRLEYAFIGFAFVSMGVGLTVLSDQLTVGPVFEIGATLPFIVGFATLYLSLYR